MQDFVQEPDEEVMEESKNQVLEGRTYLVEEASSERLWKRVWPNHPGVGRGLRWRVSGVLRGEGLGNDSYGK